MLTSPSTMPFSWRASLFLNQRFWGSRTVWEGHWASDAKIWTHCGELVVFKNTCQIVTNHTLGAMGVIWVGQSDFRVGRYHRHPHPPLDLNVGAMLLIVQKASFSDCPQQAKMTVPHQWPRNSVRRFLLNKCYLHWHPVSHSARLV